MLKIDIRQNLSLKRFFPGSVGKLPARAFTGLSLFFLSAIFCLTVAAQTTVTVNQANMQNWLFYNDENDTVDNTLGTFVYGPGTAPMGTGGVRISVSGTQRRNLATYQFSGTPLANITTLRFSTYNPSAGNGGSAARSGYLQFNVDFNGSDTWQRRLVYLPGDNGAIVQNSWQEWDAVNSGNAVWRYSGGNFPAPNPSATKTWAQILADYPGVRIRVTDSFLGIRVGEPYADGYTENIDAFKFGTSAGTTFFNFDPAPATLLVDDDAAQCPTAGYATIQAAANAANPGDIIQVCAGNYPEYVTTNKNLVFRGPQFGVDARTGRTNPANEAIVGTVNGAFNLQVTPGTTTVDGFTMSGGVAVGDTPALLLLGGSGHQIINNIIAGNSRGAYFGSTNTTFKHNRLNNSGDGIFGNADNTTIEENLFAGGHANGAVNSTISTGDPQPDNYRLINNVSLSSGNFAVIFATNNGQVTGNTVTNASASAIFIGGGNTNLLISNNSITGGSSTAVSFSGGFGYPADSNITVRSNTLNNNVRGVNVGSGANGATGININFNRIVGNTTAGINNTSSVAVNAENNWWGCNYGPGATGAGCSGTTNAVTGANVDANPWLTLTTSASPNSVLTGGNSTVTSSLIINSASANTSASGTVPNGTPASFAATLGTVAPPSGTTSAGVVSTVFTAGASAGTGNAATTIDGQTVNAPINIAFSCNNVSIPTNIQTLRNNQITVPINVDNVTGRGIISFDYTLTYNASIVTYLGTSQTGTLSNGMTITVNSTSPGTLIVSGFGVTPLSGSGTLINLNFFATGAVGTSSPMNFGSFTFNEGIPCVNVSNGDVDIISGEVSGTITYANAAVSTPVPYATLNGAGSVNVSTQTNLSGAYTLSGFGSGPYTVTPTKTGDVNGITSFDSGRIAQHVVGLISLNSTQLIAADVSNNGTVTSFDAALIAQYIVLVPNPGVTGTWKFIPANRSYPNVETSQVNQDYSAILMGEVSGNWAPPTTFAPLAAEQQLGGTVSVTAPTVNTSTGASLSIPITVGDTTGQGIISVDADISFDPTKISPTASPCDVSGTLFAGGLATCNVIAPGVLRISIFRATPLTGSGVLIKLNFTVIGPPGTNSPLNWLNFTFNEGDPADVTTNGAVNIAGPTAANVEISGQVMTFEGEFVRNAIVVLTDSSGNDRTVRTNSFGVYKFAEIPVGANYTISVRAKGLTFLPQVLVVNDAVNNLMLIAEP